MYEETQVVCSKCGKECTVPFKPDGNRPVFCRECYIKRGNGFVDKRKMNLEDLY